MTRALAHERFEWRPTTFLVNAHRYRCAACVHVWRQDSNKAAEPRTRILRRGLRCTLEAVVCQHLTIARVGGRFGVARNTATDGSSPGTRRATSSRDSSMGWVR